MVSKQNAGMFVPETGLATDECLNAGSGREFIRCRIVGEMKVARRTSIIFRLESMRQGLRQSLVICPYFHDLVIRRGLLWLARWWRCFRGLGDRKHVID